MKYNQTLNMKAEMYTQKIRKNFWLNHTHLVRSY